MLLLICKLVQLYYALRPTAVLLEGNESSARPIDHGLRVGVGKANRLLGFESQNGPPSIWHLSSAFMYEWY